MLEDTDPPRLLEEKEEAKQRNEETNFRLYGDKKNIKLC